MDEEQKHTLSVAINHNALDDVRVLHGLAENLAHANVFYQKIGRVLGHHHGAGFSDQRGEHVLDAVLLGGDGGVNTLLQRLGVVEVDGDRDGQRRQDLSQVTIGGRVTRDDLGRVHATVNQHLGELQQLAAQDDNEIAAIADLSANRKSSKNGKKRT
jgi:hypothetical protein